MAHEKILTGVDVWHCCRFLDVFVFGFDFCLVVFEPVRTSKMKNGFARRKIARKSTRSKRPTSNYNHIPIHHSPHSTHFNKTSSS